MEDETEATSKSFTTRQKTFVFILAVTLAILIAALIPDYANDFTCFYEAGSKIASLESPYSVACYYSPVWVALLFSALSIFTREIAYRIYAAILFGSYIFIIWRISKQNLLISLIACCSPFIFITMQYGNIDWLVLLGLIVPKYLGIWLVLTKPQMGFTLILIWAWKIVKEQGVQKLIANFTPVALGLFVSLLLGMRIPNPGALSAWSADIWPFGLLIGIPAFVFAIYKRDELLALGAAPFLTPYVGAPSWVAILPKAMQKRKYTAIAVVFSWLLIIFWRLGL
jgi:hypothetical protein